MTTTCPPSMCSAIGIQGSFAPCHDRSGSTAADPFMASCMPHIPYPSAGHACHKLNAKPDKCDTMLCGGVPDPATCAAMLPCDRLAPIEAPTPSSPHPFARASVIWRLPPLLCLAVSGRPADAVGLCGEGRAEGGRKVRQKSDEEGAADDAMARCGDTV